MLAAREKRDRLMKELESLRVESSPKIRKRLADADRGSLSESKIRELEVAVEKARRKKEAFAQQFTKIKVEGLATADDTFETTYFYHQIESRRQLEDQLKKNLAQLKFEANQDRYRVALIDPAAAPKAPSSNLRLKYMAAAPMVVFCLLLGLFLVKELAAGQSVE